MVRNVFNFKLPAKPCGISVREHGGPGFTWGQQELRVVKVLYTEGAYGINTACAYDSD